MSGYNLKRGLLNEDEALEIILKGGSGFGTPKLGQSPKVTDSPKVGSFTATDVTSIQKPAPLRGRNNSSSPTVNLSESCPTNNHMLFSSPKIGQLTSSYNRDIILPTEHDTLDTCDTKLDLDSKDLSESRTETSKTRLLTEFPETQTDERLNRIDHSKEYKRNEESLSSSESDEEISIYQSSRRKEYVQQSRECDSETHNSRNNIHVIPLINSINPHNQADTAKISKIKPCDTITASDAEDDFTNVIVTSTFSPPSASLSSIASSTSKEDVKILPCLSGFIDSWKPFGQSRRYFDTPPDTKLNHVQSFGFRFQRDVTVPGLNVADSQYMLQLFDYIETEKGDIFIKLEWLHPFPQIMLILIVYS